MNILKDTNWRLVERISESETEVNPQGAFPGDLLQFMDTSLLNWDDRFGSDGLNYSLSKNEIFIRYGPPIEETIWTIQEHSSDRLIISHLSYRYIYKRVISPNISAP